MIELLKSLNIHQYDVELIDIRIEETQPCTISFFQKEFHGYNEERNFGAFIRVYAKKKWYYTSTTEIDKLEVELHKLLKTAKVSIKKNEVRGVELNETVIENVDPSPQPSPERGSTLPYAFRLPKEDKIAYLKTIRDIIEDDPLVINPYVVWGDYIIQKSYINNKGVVYSYDKAWSGIMYYFSLKENDNIFDTYKQKTFRFVHEIDNLHDEFTDDFVEAKLFINAPTIKPGKYPVVLSPQATGIFAHESFGHKSEADFMIGDPKMKEEWEIGKKVANDMVTIVDSGCDPSVTGFFPIDDDGTAAQKTYLIKNGILTGRLHTEETARILEEEVTGNAQAINFEFEPVVRMTNTYFENGDLSFEEMIKPVKMGYFIKTVTHGSGMSTFTMAVNRAYKIENGKLTEPVRINVTTGTVFETLHNIDGVGDEVEIISSVFGGCGKNYQWPLRVSFGGPYLRLKEYNLS
jgi:TldD protein